MTRRTAIPIILLLYAKVAIAKQMGIEKNGLNILHRG